MRHNILASAIINIFNEQAKEAVREKKKEPYILLYVDAKPSESIQKHELPGLGVAAIFVYSKDAKTVDVPIKQYKEYGRSEKAAKALELKNWMKAERERNNLTIVGFMNALDQSSAARLGLDLIEELPDTRIEKHYNQYRLYFGNEHIDFAHAVALLYYMFTVSFAILLVALSIDEAHREHMIALLDRFPDESKGGVVPGNKSPTTQGMKFMHFLKANAKTFTGIDAKNKASGIAYRLDTLEGWKSKVDEKWKDPKKHPHFTLVDWLVAAAIAHRFPEKFVEEFRSSKLGKKKRNAEDTQEALEQLYQEFKKHKIFEIADERTLGMIKSDKKQWEVPGEAKQFIYDRAAG
ncbi:hypothetical protein LHU53_02260 [Rhodoferax sp. U2-2l]|uniref:hypothetical protein n=1 Tax=Rhodoferax sp. U2-2l TaxID=2884000 RepID=UPI001D0AF269|nr:hypothetical protein [Rhodoferax sp. U2-2l]MCB8745725.1 hypothetical protein [Rhodoferax sp. U2-2l]